ncbi:chemotaxis protein CheW [Aurantimonas sp. Leaf443]|uniref:chemotaxis protein CheW n=1 Tax=Aurantimonas sp. Leaf443 TaxID=1736378 RepID=UPI0006F7AF2D|nr:chemotaxis protein CheW [Aurantimonas sp. Leaf443]KQT86108.1 hypothetical protein ASG48_05880 [Aurantimonas sp. Leaf443]
MSGNPDFDRDSELEGPAPDREFLTFQMGTAAFAIPVRQVREVLDYRPVEPLANAPSSVLGVIDVRNVAIPVMDLKSKLAMPDGERREVGSETRIVVLEFVDGERQQTVAVIADAVHEVADLGEEPIEAAPDVGEAWDSGFMKGLGRRKGAFLTLLEIDRLFDGAVARLATKAALAA